jgi:uncharacterized protein (UPF0332 family)
MTSSDHLGHLGRAEQELDAARLLAANGYDRQAVSRAYYAAFYAAEEALLAIGVTRSKHSAVIAAFVQFVVRDHGVDEKAGRLLRSLFERRGEADYGTDPGPPADANVAVHDAELVVATVTSWMKSRAT